MFAAAVDRLLRDAVRSGAMPHVAAIAADRDGPVYEGAAGPRAVGWPGPLTVDTVLRISSMTATVTAVAALQQLERGHLELDAPVDLYCPEFARLRVLEGFDGDTPKLRPAGARATVRQLATHSSGLGYWFLDPEVLRWESLTCTPNVLSGSAAALTAPMTADPGVRFAFGIGSDWLGKVVEAASGQSLDAYLDAQVFGPLGMNHTSFVVPEDRRGSVAPVHVRDAALGWTPTRMDWNREPDWWSGGHGLYSTPRDFMAFQRMLLGAGRLGDAEVLAPRTVAAMFTDQLGGLRVPLTIRTADPTMSRDCSPGRDVGWGLGMLVTAADRPGARAAGSGSWTGVFNTHFWVDPANGVAGAMYSQFLPFAEPSAARTYLEFERRLYASL
jgi:CubicO group peptidase (beta-lactamase class C family)